MPIRGFQDKDTEGLFAGKRVKRFQAFERQAVKALTKLQAAVRLGDLRSPPSNRFEALSGDRQGQYNSIRINDQWRVCFIWVSTIDVPTGTDALLVVGDADRVEITDYH
jgi:proteic killer suppression protein